MSVTNSATASPTPPEKLIYEHLRDNGQRISWLAKRLGISRPYLHLMLAGKDNNKRTLTPEYREKINQILRTNY